jgi:hypothetical protein
VPAVKHADSLARHSRVLAFANVSETNTFGVPRTRRLFSGAAVPKRTTGNAVASAPGTAARVTDCVEVTPLAGVAGPPPPHPAKTAASATPAQPRVAFVIAFITSLDPLRLYGPNGGIPDLMTVADVTARSDTADADRGRNGGLPCNRRSFPFENHV